MDDLFGPQKIGRPCRDQNIELALVLHDERPKSWLLGETLDGRLAKWVPKSEARRGDGRDANIWTMPIWLARDRGWA